MVRTLVIPQEENISIKVPQNYVGKQIEVLLYSVDELIEQQLHTKSKNAARYKGIFTKEEGENFNHHIRQARNEWDRDS